MKRFKEQEEEEIRRLQEPGPFAVENALRGEGQSAGYFGAGPSSFLEDGDDEAPQMASLNRDQSLGATQRKEQQIADAATSELEHLSDTFVEKQDRSLAEIGKKPASDEGLRDIAAKAE